MDTIAPMIPVACLACNVTSRKFGMTPAMKAGLADHVWSIEELIRTSAVAVPAQK